MKYPHAYLTVSLLDGCNKACAHCYRTAVPSDHGFKLNRQDAHRAIDDASALGTACIFVGGEPTIWADGDRDYVDLLIAAGNRHGRAALLSNGHVFEQEHIANGFVKRFVEGSDARLSMKFTVDALHDNYDRRAGRIRFIDNLLEATRQYDRHHQISISFLTHWTRDERANMPAATCEAYETLGVQTSIEDFMAWGRAEALAHDACYVVVGDSDTDTLGPFKEQLLTRLIAGGVVEDAAEFESLSNRELLSRLHVCGRTPNFTISWGVKYYYCIPQMGFDWFAISDVGALDAGAMAGFMERRPVIREIQERSIFGLVDTYSEFIDDDVLTAIGHTRENIRFAGCSVCLKLRELGVLERINAVLQRGARG